MRFTSRLALATVLLAGCDQPPSPTEPAVAPQPAASATRLRTEMVPQGTFGPPLPLELAPARVTAKGPPPGAGRGRPLGRTNNSAVGTGNDFTCALRLGVAYCWGRNHWGQLGIGTLDDSPEPVAVAVQQPLVSLTVGDAHACGLDSDGSAWCWGLNGSGTLGVPTESEGGVNFSATPVGVTGGLSFVSVSAGLRTTCGISTDGGTYCWGRGFAGQLGNGAFDDSSTPVQVAGGGTFTSVDPGLSHTCAVDTQGNPFCWGESLWWGQSNGRTATPVPAASGVTFAEIQAGLFSTCGLDSRGRAFCWGEQLGVGDLGLGDTGYLAVTEPQAVVGGLRFSSLEMMDDNWWHGHTCAVTASGEARCWGSNGTGQLGTVGGETCEGTYGYIFDCSSSPVRVEGSVRFADISVAVGLGTGHTCAVVVGGRSIYCWGANNYGQLGVASTETCAQTGGEASQIPCSTEPALVSFP